MWPASGFRARMRIRAFLYAGYATNPRDATSRNLLSVQETSTTPIGVERRGLLDSLASAVIYVLSKVPHLQSGNIPVELVKGIDIEFRDIANVGHVEANPLEMKPALLTCRLGRVRC